MKQKSIWKGLVAFIATMVVLTFVSRGIYAYNLPKVTTTSVKNQSLDHSIEGEGQVTSSSYRAVCTIGELQVMRVMVKEGQRVKKGEVLFTLDEDQIKEKMDLLSDDLSLTQKTKQKELAKYKKLIEDGQKKKDENEIEVKAPWMALLEKF